MIQQSVEKQEADAQSTHGSSATYSLSRGNSFYSLSRGNSFIMGAGDYVPAEKSMEEAIHIMSLQSPDSSTQGTYRRVSAKSHKEIDRTVSHSGKIHDRQRTGSGLPKRAFERKSSDHGYPMKSFERGLSGTDLLKERQKSNIEDILIEGLLCFINLYFYQFFKGRQLLLLPVMLSWP